MAQAAANWGAAHGGLAGHLALNAAAAANAGAEAFGLNLAASAGDDIGSGHIVRGAAKAAALVGGIRLGGAVLSRLARAAAQPSASEIVDAVEASGARVKVHLTDTGGDGVAIDFGDGTKVDIRVENHPPHGHHGNVERWEANCEHVNKVVDPEHP